MKHEAIWKPELFVDQPNLSSQSGIVGRRDRYDLTTAIRVVRRMDTCASRVAVFDEIKEKNPLYRIVDSLYSLAGSRFLQPVILWIYMLKCVLTVGWFSNDGSRVVAIANFPNEIKTIDQVNGLLPDRSVLRLSMARKHMFGSGQLRAATVMVSAFGTVWPFLKLIARTHSFMPAARIASTLAFYMRFKRMFAERIEIRAAIIASNYSPEAVGLAAAAHSMKRSVVYANHAPVPANSAVVPPVYADCALFYGDETTRIYQRRSACTAEVALIGLPGTTRDMEWRAKLTKVGIFLTACTRIDNLAALIVDIRRTNPDVEILIRDHPVALLRNDLSQIVIDDDKVELTIGNPLHEEIELCDLIICGNSGVALNVLCGGRPVAYFSDLDCIPFDHNGFLASGLITHVPGWTSDIYEKLAAFYQAPGWVDVMQSYDASYGQDVGEMKRKATEILSRHLDS